MELIPSFAIDHDKLVPGMYISRVDAGDIVTYDLRMRVPNAGDYLTNGSLHTLEHLFATCARNGRFADHVVYFGPMGCRTGFYFITKGLPHEDAIALTQEAFAFVAAFEGEIPGARQKECGNYREHDLAAAKADAAGMVEVLRAWTPGQMVYPT